MPSFPHSRRKLVVILGAVVVVLVVSALAGAATRDAPVIPSGGARFPVLDEEGEQMLLERDFAFESRRTAGDKPLSGPEAGQLRGAAARSAAQARKAARKAGPFWSVDLHWCVVCGRADAHRGGPEDNS